MANQLPGQSQNPLDQVIPPEIFHDAFYKTILDLARSEQVQTVLEIGSSSGGGSTDAFVRGLRENPGNPRLFCMEVSGPRFHALAQRYAGDAFVHCMRASSVPVSAFPTEQQIVDFCNLFPTVLRTYPIEQVLGWLRTDINYVRSEGVPDDGIARIKREHKIRYFDLVLIDGSEFTGAAELGEVYGARVILLDDVTGYKNLHNYRRLIKDPNYVLYAENLTLRNGFAVFERTVAEDSAALHFDSGPRTLVRSLVHPGAVAVDVSAAAALEGAGDPGDGGDFPALLTSLVGPSGRAMTVAPADGLSLDAFARAQGLSRINFARLELGADLCNALEGASGLLAAGQVDFLQFSIAAALLASAGRSPTDVFALLARHGYRTHLITPDGKIAPESSVSTALYENFIAISPGAQFPSAVFDTAAIAPPRQLNVEGITPGGGYVISFGPRRP